MAVLFTPYILWTKSVTAIQQEWKANYRSILLNGLFVMGSYALILIAFTMERVSYVVGLRQLSIIFAVLLGGHLLQEKRKGLRLFAALMIFAGAFMITIAD